MSEAIRPPCLPECDRRTGGCHAKCPEWKVYEEKKHKEYERRAAECIARSESVGKAAVNRQNERSKRTHRCTMR